MLFVRRFTHFGIFVTTGHRRLEIMGLLCNIVRNSSSVYDGELGGDFAIGETGR